METKHILEAGTLLALSAVVIKYLYSQSNDNIKIDNKSSFNEEKINKLKAKIEMDTKKLKEKAIRYYILKLIPSYNFNLETEKKIFEKYPKEFSTPYFPIYSLQGEDVIIYENILKDKIKGYPNKDKYTLKDAYEQMIWDKAKTEAKMILDSYK